MNLTTYLNEQARFVRDALEAGNLDEARTALRFIFEDGDVPENLRPAMIIRLALFPMTRSSIDLARDLFTYRADEIFTAGDDLDAEIRVALYTALFQDRR